MSASFSAELANELGRQLDEWLKTEESNASPPDFPQAQLIRWLRQKLARNGWRDICNATLGILEQRTWEQH